MWWGEKDSRNIKNLFYKKNVIVGHFFKILFFLINFHIPIKNLSYNHFKDLLDFEYNKINTKWYLIKNDPKNKLKVIADSILLLKKKIVQEET